MVCPMRVDLQMEYETNEKIKTVVCTSKKEVYPECYGEECPYYSTEWITTPDGKVKEKGTCAQIGSGNDIGGIIEL